jgi:hypothetical protein
MLEISEEMGAVTNVAALLYPEYILQADIAGSKIPS